MADPLTMATVGAVAGAALNRDDPMKGALMGAALGGAGGAGYGALTGAGAAGGAAGAGAAELAAANALPPGLSTLSLGPTGLLPVDMAAVQAPQLATMVPYFPSELTALDAGLGGLPVSNAMASPAAFAYPDVDAIARASMGSDLPGLMSGASGSSAYSAPRGMQLGQAAGLLQQAQPRAQMQAPAPKRGNPQTVNYGGFASLLEPKLVERRRVSLI